MTDSPYPATAPDEPVMAADSGHEIVDRQIVRNQRTGGLETVEHNATGAEIRREPYEHPADAPPLA